MTASAVLHTYIRRETAIGAVMNGVISAAVFLAIWPWQPLPTTDLAFDFWPQSLGVAFVGTLIPSLLTLRRISAGDLADAPRPASLKRQGIACACGALALAPTAGSAAGLFLRLAAPAMLDPMAALLVKAAYGTLLGLIATPPILRHALGLPLWPSR